MSYNDVIDPATPAGADDAGAGDDRIRELKRALIERIESFFQDIDADPWVPKSGSIPIGVFVDNSIPGAKLADASIALAKLAVIPFPAPGTITNLEIGNDAVGTPELIDASVTNPKLGNDAVTTPKIADGTIRRVKLYDGLKQDLVRFAVYTLTLGAVVVAAGGVVSGFVNVDTNDQLGGAVACVIQPAFDFADSSAPTHPSDYLLMHASITLNGSQEVLVYRLHNLLAAPVDLTGRSFFIHMFQRLYSAPAES